MTPSATIPGLSPQISHLIVATVFTQAKVQQLILFGSRAKGTHAKGADIDIAILAPELSFSEYLTLHTQLNNLDIPYQVDLVHIDKVTDDAVIQHIHRVGLVLSPPAGQAQ